MNSRKASTLGLLIVCSAAMIAWALVRQDLPWLLYTGDEREYAEIARRIATGRGFTTGIFFPIEFEWGLGADHPSLLRPPMWPMVLSLIFWIAGAAEVPALILAGVLYVLACGMAHQIADRLAGPMAGLIAGLGTVMTALLQDNAVLAGTEMQLALATTLTFYLLARGANPAIIGAACGFAYLTRYNAGLLLPAAYLVLVRREDWLRTGVLCVLGFSVVCAPWWIRNAMLTGNPIFTFYSITLWTTPNAFSPSWTLLHMIDPDLDSRVAMHPVEKFRQLFPVSLSTLPLLAANAVAFVGVLVGAIRGNRICQGLVAVVVASKLILPIFAVRGRYFLPFIPATLALGTAALAMLAPRWRTVGLVGVAIAALLPAPPIGGSDVQLLEFYLRDLRQDVRKGGQGLVAQLDDFTRLERCLEDGDLVVSEKAAGVTWATDNPSVYTPWLVEDFWRIVERDDPAMIHQPPNSILKDRARFDLAFEPRSSCGPDVYLRRGQASP